jgi:hypothetical protein
VREAVAILYGGSFRYNRQLLDWHSLVFCLLPVAIAVQPCHFLQVEKISPRVFVRLWTEGIGGCLFLGLFCNLVIKC